MSQVTRLNDSCHACGLVMSHTSMSELVLGVGAASLERCAQVIQSIMCTGESVTSHLAFGRITRVNESCHTRVNESCHTRE